jgi:FAD/FMN-containing dehydrogenase
MRIIRWTRARGVRARRTRVVAGAIVIVFLATFGRSAAHLLRSALRDRDARLVTPAGFADDASRMNLTKIAEVVRVAREPAEAEAQIAALLKRARERHLKVSIAGSRHTMGGHTIAPGGIVIDLRSFNRVELDEATNILHTQAGARWDEIIPYLDARGRSIEIMQSNNSFTVGGSISANCHGWQPNRPPIVSSVEAMRVMTADGEVVRCSRHENTQLFSLVAGGYGLFGIILDVDLRVVANERYRMKRIVTDVDHLAEAWRRAVVGNHSVGMAYARLCVSHDGQGFLRDAVVNAFERSPCDVREIPRLGPAPLTGFKRTVFRGSAGSEYGKQLRWELESTLSDRLADEFVSRNQLLSDPVELYQNQSDSSVDILHEYFVPPERLAEFVERMREIVSAHGGDLLNVTLRHVQEDRDAFLRYADREMLGLVLLFNQRRSDAGEVQMREMTRELIDAAIACGGRHYLPYRLHATRDQFDAAYPRAAEFFAMKRQYDPDDVLVNQFYLMYRSAG